MSFTQPATLSAPPAPPSWFIKSQLATRFVLQNRYNAYFQHFRPETLRRCHRLPPHLHNFSKVTSLLDFICNVTIRLTFEKFLQTICGAANASCPILIIREVFLLGFCERLAHGRLPLTPTLAVLSSRQKKNDKKAAKKRHTHGAASESGGGGGGGGGEGGGGGGGGGGGREGKSKERNGGAGRPVLWCLSGEDTSSLLHVLQPLWVELSVGCWCMCVYIHIYMYIHTYMYVYICICIYKWRYYVSSLMNVILPLWVELCVGWWCKCVYIYIYICTYTYIHIHIYVYTYRWRDMYIHVRTCMYIHVCVYIYMRRIPLLAFMSCCPCGWNFVVLVVYVRVHTYICMCIYTFICIYI